MIDAVTSLVQACVYKIRKPGFLIVDREKRVQLKNCIALLLSTQTETSTKLSVQLSIYMYGMRQYVCVTALNTVTSLLLLSGRSAAGQADVLALKCAQLV